MLYVLFLATALRPQIITDAQPDGWNMSDRFSGFRFELLPKDRSGLKEAIQGEERENIIAEMRHSIRTIWSNLICCAREPLFDLVFLSSKGR